MRAKLYDFCIQKLPLVYVRNWEGFECCVESNHMFHHLCERTRLAVGNQHRQLPAGQALGLQETLPASQRLQPLLRQLAGACNAQCEGSGYGQGQGLVGYIEG